MSIYLSKNLKQKQTFALTPSLKKSIDLLQLSRFELIKKIEKEIDENPFLERAEDINQIEGSYNQDFDFETESKKTLRESLLEQLNDLNLNTDQIKLSKIINDCIDENGMLIEDIFEIEKISNHIFTANEVEQVLINVIHKMSPPGIGYRNHKECIKIQVSSSNISNKKKSLIMKILFNNNLDDLKIIKHSIINEGFSENEFNEAIKEIQKCDLSPGLNYKKIKYVEPDLKIILINENLKVIFILCII